MSRESVVVAAAAKGAEGARGVRVSASDSSSSAVVGRAWSLSKRAEPKLLPKSGSEGEMRGSVRLLLLE